MITERVANFIYEISPDKIPAESFGLARSAILDFVGVALAGSKQKTGEIISEYVRQIQGAASAGVIGAGFKAPPQLAALANGTMGHALDYDDLSFVYNAHPSVTLVPVVLALGESLGLTGKEVLMAYIVGFEVGSYVSSPVANSHYRQGWHSTGTVGVIGATAAAARLLKLDVQQTRLAFGIAVSMASGVRQNFGTMTKPLHAGNAAANGVAACLLAKQGFTASDIIIEAKSGYARTLGCNEEIDWDKASAGLGKKFILTRTALGFKPYPSCGGTLGVLDTAIYLRNKYNIKPSQIESITLGVGPFENGSLIHNPTKGLEGKFSMEYCTCRAILDGKFTLQDFTDERVNQPEVRSLMQRTKCVEKYPMASMGAGSSGMNAQSVTIKMTDNTEYFRETPMESGMPVSPMTKEQFEGKYRDCASLTLKQNDIEESLALLNNFEKLDNLDRLMKLVSKT
jgi:2-methylcitrate dehydratase PrpD